MSEKLDTELRGHHPHSPSSLQSSEACAHFENEQRESAAATAGTLQHKAAETRDLSILEDAEQVAAVNRALALEDASIAELRLTLVDAATSTTSEVVSRVHDEVVTLDVISVKEEYLAVCSEHIENVKVGVAESTEVVQGAGFTRTRKVYEEIWEKWFGITGGFPDNVLMAGPLGIILDWKFGKELVTPTAENLQGKAYAAAAFERWVNLEEIKVVFFHPHIEIDLDGQTRSMPEYTHVFKREDCERIELELRTVIAKKKLAKETGFSGPIKATPKTSLCLWCAKKADCDALGALMVLGASKHKEIEVPDVFNPNQLTKPEDYAKAYKFANTFEAVAKAIKKRVTDAALTEGVLVPGYELTRRTERILGAPSDVKRVLIEGGFITSDEYDNCATIPITKVEDKVKSKAAKGKGAARLRQFEEALTEAGLLTRDPGYMYLREVRNSKDVAVEEKPLNIR